MLLTVVLPCSKLFYLTSCCSVSKYMYTCTCSTCTCTCMCSTCMCTCMCSTCMCSTCMCSTCTCMCTCTCSTCMCTCMCSTCMCTCMCSTVYVSIIPRLPLLHTVVQCMCLSYHAYLCYILKAQYTSSKINFICSSLA